LKALVESAGDLAFSESRHVELKGLSGEHSVHELLWSHAVPDEQPHSAPTGVVMAAPAGVSYCKTEDGVRIAYTSQGSGPTIVFVPYFVESFAAQGSVEEEQAFFRRVGRGRRVVRYDGRGTGLSQREVEDFSHEAMLRDLDAVVKALDLRDFTLWGQVIGGPTAIDFAASHPELNIELVLVATFARGADVMPREQLEALMALSRANWEMASQLFADIVGREESDANIRRGALFRDSSSGDVAARILDGAYQADALEKLGSIKCRALVLQRSNDALFRFEFGKAIAEGIPNAQLVALGGESIMYNPRDVDAIAAAVDAFLAS
jgi:pimeloyl-ACP methyl ester carboxylesterase